MSCIVLCPVRNVAKWSLAAYRNVTRIKSLFTDLSIVFFYDKSSDNTLRFLNKLRDRDYPGYREETHVPVTIVHNPHTNDHWPRTWRIAHARNELLKHVDAQTDYFIVFDGDDINALPIIRPEVLEEHLKRDDWDGLSFDRDFYYDTWALSFWPFIHQCWGYSTMEQCRYWVTVMRGAIKARLRELKSGDLLEVYSAFNGFSIYRAHKFKGARYNARPGWEFDPSQYQTAKDPLHAELKLLLAKKPILKKGGIMEWRPTASIYKDQNCEHRSFHMGAIRKHKARIRISPQALFSARSSRMT